MKYVVLAEVPVRIEDGVTGRLTHHRLIIKRWHVSPGFEGRVHAGNGDDQLPSLRLIVWPDIPTESDGVPLFDGFVIHNVIEGWWWVNLGGQVDA